MKIAIHGWGAWACKLRANWRRSGTRPLLRTTADKIDEAVGYGAVRAVSKQKVLAAF